jgi:hypothetical protein
MIELGVTVAVQLVAFVVWIARLEMKVKYLQETHDLCRAARVVIDASTVNKLTEIAKQLAELGTDVKWLINSKNGGSHNEKVL